MTADWDAAAAEREAFYDATVRAVPTPTAEEERTAQLKDFGAALVASDLWPPGPTSQQVQARYEAMYARADAADPYFGMSPAERDTAVRASWEAPGPGLEATA